MTVFNLCANLNKVLDYVINTQLDKLVGSSFDDTTCTYDTNAKKFVKTDSDFRIETLSAVDSIILEEDDD